MRTRIGDSSREKHLSSCVSTPSPLQREKWFSYHTAFREANLALNGLRHLRPLCFPDFHFWAGHCSQGFISLERRQHIFRERQMPWVLMLHLLLSQDEKVNSLLIISNYNMKQCSHWLFRFTRFSSDCGMKLNPTRLRDIIVLSFALRLKTPNLHLDWT